MFNSRIVSEILKIKLSLHHTKDTWIWAMKKCDNYSVKSAYRILQQHQHMSQGESSTEAGLKPIWKKIWKLPYFLED